GAHRRGQEGKMMRAGRVGPARDAQPTIGGDGEDLVAVPHDQRHRSIVREAWSAGARIWEDHAGGARSRGRCAGVGGAVAEGFGGGAGPATEGADEAGRFGVAEAVGDGGDAEGAVAEEAGRERREDLVGERAEAEAGSGQAAAEGALGEAERS